MATDKVVPLSGTIGVLSATDHDVQDLVRQAIEADEMDRQLTIGQALRKYKKAVFWAMFLSTSLIMEGYDVVIISSFYGQSQFQNRFGDLQPEGNKVITASWQSGLSNSSLVGQLAGLIINAYAQDRFGSRRTMMVFLVWMACAIFIPFFSPSLPVLAFGEAMCGIPWGVFQTLSTSYASEVVPTVLRPYVTAYVCMCWGAGILLSSGVVRAVAELEGDLGWRLPFALQWIWPLPLFIGAYFAPESPWNAVRRKKPEIARKALQSLRSDGPDGDKRSVDSILAYIQHTTALEEAETASASFWECFRGTNLRRTEINCVIWAAQILCGNAILGYSVTFLQAAGFSDIQSFDINIALSACYIIGGIICWLLFPRLGRATIYMSGLAFMFCCLIAIGALGFFSGNQVELAIGILLVISTLANMITIGPACYPIVAETPSGRLRYKTITIGRFVYNLTGIFSNSVTPRMIQATAWNWGAKAGLFYAGTNLLCLIWCWFRLPETKDRTFGEIDVLFENRVPARKFKYTKVDQFASQEVAHGSPREKKGELEHLESV